MSVKIMSQVWELDLPHNAQSIFLALADHADDDGYCYPSVGRLAWKTGYGVRQIQRTLKELRDKHLAIPQGSVIGGRHNTVVYRLDPSAGKQKPPFQPRTERHILADIKGDNMTPFDAETEIKGDTQDAERVTFETQRVSPETQKGDIAMSPESSVTIRESSVESLVVVETTPYSPDSQITAPDFADTTPDFQSILPGPQGPTEPSKKRKGTAKESSGHDYPEWFQPLTPLKGFKPTAHNTAIQSIQAGCDDAGVNEADIIRDFAKYYRDGGRATNGWSDPVAALVKTLPVQIDKSRRLNGRVITSLTTIDYEAMKTKQKVIPGGEAI